MGRGLVRCAHGLEHGGLKLHALGLEHGGLEVDTVDEMMADEAAEGIADQVDAEEAATHRSPAGASE
ncbi:unnamed protein product [Prunus armeniaca]